MKKSLKLFLLFFVIANILCLSSIRAKNLGVYGETFPIIEENLLHVIQAKLNKMIKSGELSKKQQEFAAKAKEKLHHPLPVQKITRTSTPRSWLYDPSLTVERDIKDHKGKIIAAKGTVINPLDYLSWGTPLLFIDGHDSEHIAWAEKEDSLAKWVLVKGSPLDLEEQKNRPVYFDQAGMLTNKFGIKQVPCRISQKGKKLLIEEVTVQESNELMKGRNND